MAYYSDSQTDKILTDLEKNIYKMYNVAYAEMKETASSYFDKYKERYEQEYEAFKQGKYTEAEFKAWVKTQVARGEGYEKMADQLSKRMVEADKVASAYINDATPTIYSLNHNYEAYRISQAENVDFHLTDEQTVKELINGNNHTEFKVTSINPKRDYEWNSKKIHNALNSAILQGKPIDKLADSFYSVMKADRASAIRNARTSFTSAQNAGRLASYEQATEMGIKMEKEWICTLDDRTRDTHQELDGERVAYDDYFVTSLGNKLMYPADPEGEPCEVYNCRCTMRAVLPNINDKPRETYKDWLERQKPEEEVKELIELVPEKTNTEKMKDAMWDSYINHVEANNLRAVTEEDYGKNNIVKVNFGNIDDKAQETFIDTFSGLSSEYDTTLREVRIMDDKLEYLSKKNSFAYTYHNYEADGSTLVINQVKFKDMESVTARIRELSDTRYAINVIEGKESEYVFTHEFAHTLFDTETKLDNKRNWLGADYDKVRKARKELNDLYGDYIKAYNEAHEKHKEMSIKAMMSLDPVEWAEAQKLGAKEDSILLSKYSLVNPDEFMAEAFTASKIGTLDNEYGKKAVEIVDKYFKR